MHKRYILFFLVLGITLILATGIWAQRRGGGGGFRGGGGGGAYRGGGAVVGPHSAGGARISGGGYSTPYGGSATRSASRATQISPHGVATTGSRSGSKTTAGGSTINWGVKGGSGTGSGGGRAAGGVGGVQVTTPGGNTYTKVGGKGVAVGPEGGIAAGGGQARAISGAGGTIAGGSRGGFATGPGGTVAGGSRGGFATGPGGTIAGGSRGGIATGPGGTVAGGSRAVAGKSFATDTGFARYSRAYAGTSRYGTVHVSRSAMVTQAGYVRTGFVHYNCFTPRWYTNHPVAWRAAAWTAASIWAACTWGTVSSYCSYPAEPIYYDYGTNVTYEGDTVYVQGEPAGTTEEYSQQAVTIADKGKEAKPAEEEKWQPLGVFALVQGDERNSNTILQLAINKEGIIRGNYYEAISDSTLPIYGSVDPKTQRAAWTIGDRKQPVFEAGVANLTKDETPILLHFGEGRTQQWLLVRVEQPEEAQKKAEGP